MEAVVMLVLASLHTMELKLLSLCYLIDIRTVELTTHTLRLNLNLSRLIQANVARLKLKTQSQSGRYIMVVANNQIIRTRFMRDLNL